MPAEETDNALVRRFQRGDAGAFEELVRRHQHRVYRLASVWLHDAQAAPDATQETFMRALGGLRGFLFRAHVSTWLYRMTRNVCNELNRKHRRHRPVADSGPEPGAWDTGAEDAQTVALVRRAVGRLPERQRDVVLLRRFEELSVEDTARVLGCRPGTVKAHLSKALANLARDEALHTGAGDGDE